MSMLPLFFFLILPDILHSFPRPYLCFFHFYFSECSFSKTHKHGVMLALHRTVILIFSSDESFLLGKGKNKTNKMKKKSGLKELKIKNKCLSLKTTICLCIQILVSNSDKQYELYISEVWRIIVKCISK